MSLLQDIIAIFVESTPKIEPLLDVHDYTDQYKSELSECFCDQILVASRYEQIRPILERYKFQSQISFAPVLALIFAEILKGSNVLDQKSVFTVVPMHWTRYFIRGFHHMDRIARELCKLESIQYKALLSTRFTKRQSKLGRKERFLNRKDIFSVRFGKNTPHTVVLLDDVISTGATINECAKILKGAGVKKVVVLALAINK